MSRNTEISNSDDTIDVRAVIARVEYLETDLEGFTDNGEGEGGEYDDEIKELKHLTALLDEVQGSGGDEQWRGDWYPSALIRDSYFTEAMEELVTDIGDLPKNLPSYIEIDWEATARNLRADYSSVEFDGVTYWYRSPPLLKTEETPCPISTRNP